MGDDQQQRNEAAVRREMVHLRAIHEATEANEGQRARALAAFRALAWTISMNADPLSTEIASEIAEADAVRDRARHNV